MKIFLVGGAVRDDLLNLPVKERDWVVVGASPEMMIERGFKPVGKDFPVFLHPETKEEYALARTERKTAKGYHGFVFQTGADVTLEEDLQRRDLTINALARDEQGELIDPLDGQKDLENKTLRHVSPAFVEDPVRVLRVARFLARFEPRGFHIADETLTLMQSMSANGEISALVTERVWRELTSALAEPAPAAFFHALKQANALEIIAPELDSLFEQANTPLTNALNAAAQAVTAEATFAVLVSWAAAAGIVLDAWCAQLKAPRSYQQLTRMMPQLYALTKTSASFDAESLLHFFKQNDLLRNPSRFDIPASAWQFCALPEYLDTYTTVSVLELIKTALRTVAKADLKAVLKQHDAAQEIKVAVHGVQLQVLTELLNSLSE